VSEQVVRRFSRVLSPISDLGHHPPRPQDVTDVQLTGKVTQNESGIAHLTYRGQIAATRRLDPDHASHAQAKIVGAGIYDTRTGRLQNLTLVLDGDYRGYPPWDSLRKTEALLEWHRAEPAEQH
jgi:hypothetical protein